MAKNEQTVTVNVDWQAAREQLEELTRDLLARYRTALTVEQLIGVAAERDPYTMMSPIGVAGERISACDMVAIGADGKLRRVKKEGESLLRSAYRAWKGKLALQTQTMLDHVQDKPAKLRLHYVGDHIETAPAVAVGPPPPFAPDYRERCGHNAARTSDERVVWCAPELPWPPRNLGPDEENDFEATEEIVRRAACETERRHLLSSSIELPKCRVSGRQVEVVIVDSALYYHCEHCHGAVEDRR